MDQEILKSNWLDSFFTIGPLHTDTPAELLIGRPLRTHLDLLRPTSLPKCMHSSQESQKMDYDCKLKMRSFTTNDKAFVRQSSNDPPWIPGTVIEELGELTYQVQLDMGHIVRWHIDQINVCMILELFCFITRRAQWRITWYSYSLKWAWSSTC